MLLGGTGPDDRRGTEGPSHWLHWGGRERTTLGPAHWLRCFDPKCNGWGQLEDIEVERGIPCGAAAIGSYLYAFGVLVDIGLHGDQEPGCMTRFDMAGCQMAEVAGPPSVLSHCAGVACGGRVYSLGGWSYEGSVADVSTYIPDIDWWGAGPALPSTVFGMAAAEHMGAIYACGGWKAGNRDHASPALLMLDPRTRVWSALPAMSNTPATYEGAAGVGGVGAAVVSGRLYVPGSDHSGHAGGTLWCYDVAAGRWDTGCAPMAEERCSLAVAALQGEVWAVGGGSHGPLATVEVYSPRLNTWRAGVPLP